jgi:hypothetical protein
VVIGLSLRASIIANRLTAVLVSGSRNKEGDATTRGLANLARSLSKLGLGCAVVVILYSASTIQIAPVLADTAIQFLDATLCFLNPSVANQPGMLKKAPSCNATFQQLGIPAGQAPDPTRFVYQTRPPPVAIGFSFFCPAAVFLLYGGFYMYVLVAALYTPALANPSLARSLIRNFMLQRRKVMRDRINRHKSSKTTVHAASFAASSAASSVASSSVSPEPAATK